MTQSQQSGNSPDGKKLLNQEQASIIGGIATIFIGFPAAGLLILKFFSLGGTLIQLLFVAYAVGMVVQYWMSRAYKDGLTWGGVGKLFSWPLDMYRAVRAGGVKGATTAWSRPASIDDGKPIMNEQVALWGGVVVTVGVALLTLFYGIGVLIGAIGGLIWVAVLGWFVGCFVYFWSQKLHMGGLTVAKLLSVPLWPADYIRRAYRGFRARVRNI